MTSVPSEHEPANPAARFGLLSTGRLTVFGALSVLAGGFLAVAGLLADDPWLLASGLAWSQIGLLVVVVGLERTSTPLAHPLLLWCVTLFFGAAVRPLYFRGQSASERTNFLAGLPDSVVATGATISALFFTCVVAAYLVAKRPPRQDEDQVPFALSDSSARSMTVLAIAVSLVGIFLYTRTLGIGLSDLSNQFSAKRRVEVEGRFGAVGNYLWIGSIAGFAALLLAFARRQGHLAERRWVALIALCVVVGLTCSVLAGSRNDMLLVGLYLTAISTDFGRSFRTRTALTGLAMFVGIVVVFAGLRSAASNDLSVVRDLASNDSLGSIVGTHNWAGVEKTGIIATRVPERMDFQRGRSFALAPIAPIPRSVWSGKPNVRIGPEIGERIFDLDRDGRTGLPPGLPGELFLNFGYLGIVLGGGVFGLLLATAHRRFLETAEDSPTRVIWLILLVNVGLKMPGGDFTGIFTEIFMSTLILGGLIHVMRAPQPSVVPQASSPRSTVRHA